MRRLLEASSTAQATLRLVLLLLQLICATSRGLASSIIAHGLLQSCHAVLARAFVFGPFVARPAGRDASENDRLAASVLGIWRCCAAYALTEPPLDSFYPLFSQATTAARGTLSTSVLYLLETLCSLPRDAKLVGVQCGELAPHGEGLQAGSVAAQGPTQVGQANIPSGTVSSELGDDDEAIEAEAERADIAASIKNATDASLVEEIQATMPWMASAPHSLCEQAGQRGEASLATDTCALPQSGGALGPIEVPPACVEGDDISLSSRWRFLSAYVPAALRIVHSASDAEYHGLASSVHLDVANRVAASMHMLASYLRSLQTLQRAVNLPLIPWCEQMSSRLVAFCQGGTYKWAFETLLSGQSLPSSAQLGVALECLFAHSRLLWELSRINRGLLMSWAVEDSMLLQPLWQLCQVLPHAIGSPKTVLASTNRIVGETPSGLASPPHVLSAASVALTDGLLSGRSMLTAAGAR